MPKPTLISRFTLNYTPSEPDHPWMADAVEADGILAKIPSGHVVHGHGATPTEAVKECCKWAKEAGWLVPDFDE